MAAYFEKFHLIITQRLIKFHIETYTIELQLNYEIKNSSSTRKSWYAH